MAKVAQTTRRLSLACRWRVGIRAPYSSPSAEAI
jgi:hypothetical protein